MCVSGREFTPLLSHIGYCLFPASAFPKPTLEWSTHLCRLRPVRACTHVFNCTGDSTSQPPVWALEQEEPSAALATAGHVTLRSTGMCDDRRFIYFTLFYLGRVERGGDQERKSSPKNSRKDRNSNVVCNRGRTYRITL